MTEMAKRDPGKRKPRRASGNRNPRRWLELDPYTWAALDSVTARKGERWTGFARKAIMTALAEALTLAIVATACGGIADQRAEPTATAGASADPVAHCELSVSPGYPCYGDLQVTCDTAARAPAELVGSGMECISGLSRLKPDYTTIWCCK